MAKDDYTSTGGNLKLKGTKDAGISKHKKKKKAKPSEPPTQNSNTVMGRAEQPNTGVATARPIREGEDAEGGESRADVKAGSRSPDAGQSPAPAPAPSGAGQTDAERRHEEMRRRRLQDRLTREGPKTHKERVEELNKYLSTLSEHHDMPRIGPG